MSGASVQLAARAAVVLTACCVLRPIVADETPEQRYVLGIERIWDRPGHAAFTDVVLHGDYLYCAFREGSGHIPGLNGQVRVIRSRDRMNWESVALLEEPQVDLRDPKLSIAPDGRVLVNMGASYYHGTRRLGIESRVSFAAVDGRSFGAPVKVVFPREMVSGADWLWRITWHKGQAWGCVQQLADRPDGKVERGLRLVRSNDGVHFEHVTKLAVDAPSETTLRFLADDTLLAMIRCEGNSKIGRVGTARPPYAEWKFVDADRRFGGPNFVELSDGRWLAGSREYAAKSATTALWWLEPASGKCRDLLTLPSGGDNSYPGFAIDRPAGRVYVSYYSSHEGKAAIYLATLRLAALEASPAPP